MDKWIQLGIDKNYITVDESNSINYIAQKFHDNLSDPEEKVRAGLFVELIENYKYTNSKDIIDLEFNRTIGHPYKKNASRLDIIIYREDKTPFAIFELKSEKEYEQYFEDSIKTQLFERAANEDKGSGNLYYLIYYTRFIEENELIEKFQTIDYTKYKTWEQWDDAGRPNLRVIPKHYSIIQKPPQYVKGSSNSINCLRDNVRVEELNRIADDLHQILWGGGQHQNDLFYNLIGLFLTKIYDEKIKDNKEPYDFQIFYEGEEQESPKTTYDRINKLYKGYLDPSTNKHSQCSLNYLLGFSDEKLKKTPDIAFDSNKVRYVVEALQSLSFTSNKYDVLGDFFEKIVRSELKQTKGQYLTHHNIVDFIIKALRVDDLTLSPLRKVGGSVLVNLIYNSCYTYSLLVKL